MNNLLAATWKLSLYQMWNRKRRWVSLALFLFPVVIVGIAAFLRPFGGDGFYTEFVPGIFGSVLVPFVALYWGSGALSDEIEGKTLVYLWTRPRDRGFLIFLKMAGCWFWVSVLSMVGIGAAYLYNYSGSDSGALMDNAMLMVWDWRALTLAGIAWSCIGFLLSVFTKRPLTYGLLIAYLWELIPAAGPGFLRRISVTQQMLALSTHKIEKGGMMRRLVDQVVITEWQALMTLTGLAGICAVLGIWLANQREFFGDEAARSQ